ncbi:hypothetical protein BBBOND_0101260 [Babesia bigemina]|uniref:Uncharacterized protein n=1 Tax=Babesia bigemina TaxID=5866 RepID=A0A061D128_BABBI|nr:hypothetical protein BBBOND_0101260 [Babesia bigemina]CDR93797.1 hypothetical protein BBBOND_0101260 [Babesia bigemina]|eukprot:XP_012765983.1 hypothetical protein BBBOND_0101260 [Babesia bigemina]
MVYFTLTQAPRNLKEGIDWLIAVKGDDGMKNLKSLGTAVYDFLADKPVGFTEVPALEEVKRISKEFLEQPELMHQRFVQGLVTRFNKRIGKQFIKYFRFAIPINESDYANVVVTRHLLPEKIAENLSNVVTATDLFLDDIKNPDKYKSAYSSEATWDASCSTKPEDCAAILVGISPMLFSGLLSLQRAGTAANRKWSKARKGKRLRELLGALGYKEEVCRNSISGSDVVSALRDVKERTLEILYDLCGFWAFY